MVIDLAIGTRFYYDGRLCEVVEAEHECCQECVLAFKECNIIECTPKLRQDGKDVCFKYVKNKESKTMKSTNIVDVECNDAAIIEVKKMVYRGLDIYAVKRSIDSSNMTFGPFFGFDTGFNAEWWCGYVEVPEDMHNLFKPEGHLDRTILDELDDPDSYNLAHVHEGYTYIGHRIPRVLDKGPKLFLGWDYNHFDDIWADVTYDYVIDEGKRVIDSMLEKINGENSNG